MLNLLNIESIIGSMSMAEIKELLKDFNPWWKQEFELVYKERELFAQLQKFLPLPQMIALTGLRRVGKTTLMFKIVEDAIKGGVEPTNIVYFSFDEFTVAIRTIMKVYEELLEKNLRKGKYILLLDEVQKVDDWENQLKTVYDTFGQHVKIVISGSESLFIKRKSKETLAGRMFEFRVQTLSFKEFLSFKGAEFKPVDIYTRELAKLFNEFTFTLGLPELVGITEKDIIKKYVREGLVEKIVYRDIPTLFRIKDITVMESLLNIFTEEPGQLVDISTLAKQLGISRQTLAMYLDYLEKAFLLRKLYNFSKNQRKVERKLKKFYPTLISVDLLFREDNLSKSKVFEWLLVNQLQAEFFWRDPYKNEVDVVIPNKIPKPVEIKYGKIDTTGLSAFMRKFNINEGYVISSSLQEKRKIDGKNIFITPAFKFLLEFNKKANAK